MLVRNDYADTSPAAGSDAVSCIAIDNVAVEREGNVILQDVDLEVNSGDFICLLGSSGVGKSTLLRVIGGLLPASGSVRINGQSIAEAWREIAYVFQQPRLLPWRTARQNVRLAAELRLSRRSASEYNQRAMDVLHLVGIDHLADRRAHKLSGGEAQRVAIARALLLDPPILLMDEPFSALDVNTRLALRSEMVTLWKKTRKTIVFVTHDIEEALAMATRVVVLGDKPARVSTDLSMTIGYPRDESVPEYKKMKELIMRHFES